MSNLLILIPSYKRPQVLNLTLKSLAETLVDTGAFNVSVVVGLNQVDDASRDVAESCLWKFTRVKYTWKEYVDNVGKALCLNDLMEEFGGKSDYVITLDNDMVLREPWLHLIDVATKINFDLMGFASTLFWSHVPPREECPVTTDSSTMLYKPIGIAGGMMLFRAPFLREYKWTNFGGVYGRDDQQMCLRAEKKYVLWQETPWLEHDPLANSTEELRHYETRKHELLARNEYVLPKGWDE